MHELHVSGSCFFFCVCVFTFLNDSRHKKAAILFSYRETGTCHQKSWQLNHGPSKIVVSPNNQVEVCLKNFLSNIFAVFKCSICFRYDSDRNSIKTNLDFDEQYGKAMKQTTRWYTIP